MSRVARDFSLNLSLFDGLTPEEQALVVLIGTEFARAVMITCQSNGVAYPRSNELTYRALVVAVSALIFANAEEHAGTPAEQLARFTRALREQVEQTMISDTETKQ